VENRHRTRQAIRNVKAFLADKGALAEPEQPVTVP
jgi:hypothetical protein